MIEKILVESNITEQKLNEVIDTVNCLNRYGLPYVNIEEHFKLKKENEELKRENEELAEQLHAISSLYLIKIN
jgi:cell shape-determining protein MreC